MKCCTERSWRCSWAGRCESRMPNRAGTALRACLRNCSVWVLWLGIGARVAAGRVVEKAEVGVFESVRFF